ncbi:hypothetical protein MWJ95_16985 [Lysinibacillus sp. Bpr_S20]|nr:hypothetical protein [Lysinibacillus sp. Bpr_S20]
MTNIQLQQDFGSISMELLLGDSLGLPDHFWDLPDHFPGSFALRESEASAKKHSTGTEINPLTRIAVKSSNFFTFLVFFIHVYKIYIGIIVIISR